MQQKTSNKSGPNKNDYNMGFGHNEADRYKKEMKAHSVQSKEFTDALNFVLNYRESMEGMDGFIPSSDLAEMLVIYNQSQPLPNTVPQDDGWVRVGDGLPEVDDEVIIVNSMKEVYLGYITEEKRFYNIDGSREKFVTHWRNLPPPPSTIA